MESPQRPTYHFSLLTMARPQYGQLSSSSGRTGATSFHWGTDPQWGWIRSLLMCKVNRFQLYIVSSASACQDAYFPLNWAIFR